MLILKLQMDYKSDFRKFFNKIRKNNQIKINEFLELQFCDALFMGFSQFHELKGFDRIMDPWGYNTDHIVQVSCS